MYNDDNYPDDDDDDDDDDEIGCIDTCFILFWLWSERASGRWANPILVRSLPGYHQVVSGLQVIELLIDIHI